MAEEYRPSVTAAKMLEGLEERWADIRGVRVRYAAGGEGEPVVLLHGLGGAAVNWDAVAPTLAAGGFRVLVPNLPGHAGSSGLPAVRDLTPFADVVHELCRREDMLPATLVGHSLGGAVAIRHAARHPVDTAGLVLAGAAGLSTSSRVAELVIGLMVVVKPGRRLARFRRPIAASSALRWLVLRGWGTGDPAALPMEAVDALLRDVRLHTDVTAAGRALVREDTRALLEGVRCPTLVLWGADDTLVGVEDGFAYARALHAELRVIAECGHLLILERPAACAGAIACFVTRVAR